MPRTIRRLEATGVHGRFSLSQRFEPGMNIIYGRNGTGKTTALHILANILNEDYERFAHLQFSNIYCEFDDLTYTQLDRSSTDWDASIRVTSESGESVFSVRHALESERARTAEGYSPNDIKQSRAAYFPAFRTMIEAWASLDDYPSAQRSRLVGRTARLQAQDVTSTRLARDLFGNFVPQLSFPSPNVIEFELAQYLDSAYVTLASKDRKLLDKAILDIVRATVSGGLEADDGQITQDVLDELRQLSATLSNLSYGGQQDSETSTWQQLSDLVLGLEEEPPKTLSPILHVYLSTLRARVDEQNRLFKPVEKYLASVNSFLEQKQLSVSTGRRPRKGFQISLQFEDGSHLPGLTSLSSGERQIVTLLYASTQMSSQDVVLIDEPEISLHVDWQRTLLPSMQMQLGERQVITTTHSPVIGAEHSASSMELVLTPSDNRGGELSLFSDTESM